MSSEQAQSPEAKAFAEQMLAEGNHRKESAKAVILAMGFKFEETEAK